MSVCCMLYAVCCIRSVWYDGVHFGCMMLDRASPCTFCIAIGCTRYLWQHSQAFCSSACPPAHRSPAASQSRRRPPACAVPTFLTFLLPLVLEGFWRSQGRISSARLLALSPFSPVAFSPFRLFAFPLLPWLLGFSPHASHASLLPRLAPLSASASVLYCYYCISPSRTRSHSLSLFLSPSPPPPLSSCFPLSILARFAPSRRRLSSHTLALWPSPPVSHRLAVPTDTPAPFSSSPKTLVSAILADRFIVRSPGSLHNHDSNSNSTPLDSHALAPIPPSDPNPSLARCIYLM